jgi:hypothetical protein
MNTLRKAIDLKPLTNMNATQSLVFSHLFGNKGRNFTTDTLVEKLGGSIIPEDTKKSDLEKVTKSAKSKVTKALKFLHEAGIIQLTKGEDKKEIKGSYVMPAYNITDLGEEIQNSVGGKAHTTLTANPNHIFYKGDPILYMPHPLSPEYKAGQRVAVATVKKYHVNEEGFLYLNCEKGPEYDADGKEKKRKTFSVKASGAQLIDEKIPEGAVECVFYKKGSGLQAPVLNEVPDLSKGRHVLFFSNIHSPKAKEFTQQLAGMKVKNLVEINTDHQVAICKEFNIRFAPTIVIVENGKEVERITNKITKVIK